MLVATWVGMGLLVVLSIIGWLIAYNKYSRNEAMHIGELKGLLEGLGGRMESLENSVDTRMKSVETRMGNLEGRIDSFIKK